MQWKELRPPLHLGVLAIEKGVTLDQSRQLFYFLNKRNVTKLWMINKIQCE